MNRKNNLLSIAIPLIILLLGAVVYKYGYLGVRAEMTEMEDAASAKLKILTRYMTLIADRPALEKNLTAGWLHQPQ